MARVAVVTDSTSGLPAEVIEKYDVRVVPLQVVLGGRLGQAASLVGSALAVKPLLHVVDGRIALCEKVRTATKALARLEELATAGLGDSPVDVAVHHLAAADKAAQLAASLRASLPGLASAYVSEVGAVLGAHVGLGLLGVVVHRR